MASITLGPLITDISGSVGGATFQRTPGGVIMRNKPRPPNQSSPLQQVIRGHMRYLQVEWAALTDAQRIMWQRFNNYGGATLRKNRNVLLSGYNLFLKYNLYRLLASRPILTTFSYSPLSGMPEFDHIGREGLFTRIWFDDDVDYASYFFMLKVSFPRSPSRKFYPSGLHYMDITYVEAQAYAFSQHYLLAYGLYPEIGDTLHLSVTWWHYTSPIFAKAINIIAIVEDDN